MMLQGLSKKERELVRRCLAAAANGIYGEDTHSVIGLHESEVEAVLQRWPHIEEDPNWELAVNNALLNAWGYPIEEDTFQQWFEIPREAIRRVYDKWKRSRGQPSGGSYLPNLQ